MPAENTEISVAASAVQDGREAHQSTSAAQSLSSDDEVAESDASSCPVCAPILVVPSSDSFISLLRTPDSSPTRPPLYSPSQARYLQSFCSDSPYRVNHFFTGSLALVTYKMKKALREMQTLRTGVEPKIFAPLQTIFPGAWDSQNLISWRWSLYLQTQFGEDR